MSAKRRAALVSLAIAIALAHAQTRPVFEVASVKRIRDYLPLATMDGDISHGHFTLNNAHIKQMIAVAYEIQYIRIEGGPAWINTDQFQIEAKAEDPGTTDKQVRVMLRNLLEDRFQLSIHRETKPLPTYTLRTAAGGTTLQHAEEGGTDRCNRTADGAKFELVCGHIEIATLANALATLLRGPVVDQTGLDGDYNFKLAWEGDDPYSGASDAVEKLGLKLEMKKIPTEVIVIDSVQQPSEN